MHVHEVKNYIHQLYNLLIKRKNESTAIYDITDCLFQVYQKVELVKNPEMMISALSNYIYVVSLNGRVQYSKEESNIISKIAQSGNAAGLNVKYRSDYTDKSQFYSFIERIPYREQKR
ncbi:bacteriocin immunity protein [Enterococcus cecorum]